MMPQPMQKFCAISLLEADGLYMAAEAIDSGKVKHTLDALVAFTQGASI